MINKKSIWFITLFTLILVLSVYYVTMPSELLLSNSDNYVAKKDNEKEKKSKETAAEVTETEILTSLRVESNEKVQEKLESLKAVLTNAEATVDEKNAAYEEIKTINVTRGEEETYEKLILDEYKLKSYVKIDGDQIKVVALTKEHDITLANNIMRSIQAKCNKKMYISVQFENA